jgi:uncharacterized membrane protein YeaQ/YmgE (transglycosylase-associated protein family)
MSTKRDARVFSGAAARNALVRRAADFEGGHLHSEGVLLIGKNASARITAMHILWTIIIGFLAGLVAKLITPGRDPSGFIITTLLGIAGAVIATYLGQAVGWYQAGEGAGFLGAIVGAVIILAIYHAFRRSA